MLLLCLAGLGNLRAAEEPYVRGSDQIFWVPTLEQALRMSRDTGRSILLMGYTLVDENAATYSYKGGEQCSSVF
jgi:hypothetical protein